MGRKGAGNRESAGNWLALRLSTACQWPGINQLAGSDTSDEDGTSRPWQAGSNGISAGRPPRVDAGSTIPAIAPR